MLICLYYCLISLHAPLNSSVDVLQLVCSHDDGIYQKNNRAVDEQRNLRNSGREIRSKKKV